MRDDAEGWLGGLSSYFDGKKELRDEIDSLLQDIQRLIVDIDSVISRPASWLLTLFRKTLAEIKAKVKDLERRAYAAQARYEEIQAARDSLRNMQEKVNRNSSGLQSGPSGSTGAPGLGGLGSIGGSGHGFGGGSAGPNTRSFHGIPGMGGFGKRPGDDEGGPGAPGVHGSGFQGNFGNGFFGSGFLHPGVGLGGGLTGGGSSPSGGGLTGKHKTGGGSGTTGGSYVDASTRNDARGSGSDRERSGGGGGGGVDRGDESAEGHREDVDRTEESAHPYGPDDHEDSGRHEAGHLQSKPGGDGGGDTGGNASESRPTFTGYHPAHSGPAGAATIGVGVSHLPGSPISYITATSDVGGVGGTTEGFGGTNPNVRVYRPDPEASGGSGGPRNPYLRPSDEAGSPRGPGARIAGQGAVASTAVRTRLR